MGNPRRHYHASLPYGWNAHGPLFRFLGTFQAQDREVLRQMLREWGYPDGAIMLQSADSATYAAEAAARVRGGL